MGRGLMVGAVSFRRQVLLFADKTLSPAAQSARLAARAKEELAEVIRSGRASPEYIRYVDGVAGASEERVRPADGGQIVYRFAVLGPVAAFALGFLIGRSPAASERPTDGKHGKPTHFRDGFYLGIDGRFIKPESFDPKKVSAGVQEIVIGNRVAYSRKLDVQLIGMQRLHYSVPAAIFSDAAEAVRQRFGTICDVRRVYDREFPGKYDNKFAPKLQSPALLITPRR